MLNELMIDQILERLPSLTVGVIGDLFLDRYLDIDATLNEPSLETGLTAYQVVRVRAYPGAAGTVINNLAALGVGRICVISVIGDDGEGFELRQALAHMPSVDPAWIISDLERRTPTYTKPMLSRPGQAAEELNRLDIKNRTPTSIPSQHGILAGLAAVWPQVDAMLVLDQVSEPECGVITSRIRERLSELGAAMPKKPLLADSRERVGLFRSMWTKPNETECRRASPASETLEAQVSALSQQTGRPVFCTCGARGIFLADPIDSTNQIVNIFCYPVRGPLDVVGAGDSTSAAIACAVTAGATLAQAAAFGNLVASITIQQIGTTGTASPGQVRERWREVAGLKIQGGIL
jgi:bifunctional ADP-heptose synthase (sugar kinase/adenylyltransferase)